MATLRAGEWSRIPGTPGYVCGLCGHRHDCLLKKNPTLPVGFGTMPEGYSSSSST
ncbi:hypothetical protein [Streptomyces longisporoflavus]|uniref:Uncharacterized protein n=1 Tax=Streptomyces longisporoflavus TaxID=28044 RepID=A0ABW7QGX2_9ACTN